MKNWHEMSQAEVLDKLESNASRGLSQHQATQKLDKYGPNAFVQQKKESIGKMILQQFRDISTIILILAGVLSLVMAIREGHGYIEPIVIFAIVIMNMVLGISQERSAEKALDALNDLNSPSCYVIRDGVQHEINTISLVPGDIISLKTGDLVPADARLLQSVNLSVDESSLTGESEASEKNADTHPEEDAGIGDQSNMVFSGCLVTAGNATAVVVSTGMNTQMGKIAAYLSNDQKLKTPLQIRLDKIGKLISYIAIASGIALLGIGLVQGEDFWHMAILAVSLAVAAVPETLSLIVTLSLSQGVKNMVKKNALIRKLPAVETLGNTSIICSDKTGTLTQNRMSIKRLYINGEAPFKESVDFDDHQLNFLKKLALASNAKIEKDEQGNIQIIGDPTEKAILRLLDQKGINQNDLEQAYPRVAEIPFSSERKMMTTVHTLEDGTYLVLTKGAFDRLPCEPTSPEYALSRKAIHDSFAQDALRVIALASKRIDIPPSQDDLSSLEKDLKFEGIIGLIDPPRPEAIEAIKTAKKAGIRTIMITGDHKATASAIAKEIGILEDGEKVLTGRDLSKMDDETLCENVSDYSVYARVSPEDKIRIVEAWQENGEVVSMTGDGVNDAPALKAADVGVAMGITGTEVAKNASDMVLTDDNFATIVDAVHEGRNVFSNIRKTIYFLLVCNISEIIIMIGSQLMGWGVPITPILLLLINVIGDGIPGLHLARETSDPRIMERKPIGRDESFFGGGLRWVILRQTIVFALVTWVGYYLASFVKLPGSLEPSHALGQSVSFLILGWTSILHIFTVRSRKSMFKRTVLDNIPLLISSIAMILLFALLVLVKPVGAIFGLTPIGWSQWLIVIGLSIVPTIVAEIGKWLAERKEKYAYKRRLIKHREREHDRFY